MGNIGIPWDALTPVLQMLIAGRFKFVLMRGTRFRHRTAKLNSLRLETRLTEDDVPGVPEPRSSGTEPGTGPRLDDTQGEEVVIARAYGISKASSRYGAHRGG